MAVSLSILHAVATVRPLCRCHEDEESDGAMHDLSRIDGTLQMRGFRCDD